MSTTTLAEFLLTRSLSWYRK